MMSTHGWVLWAAWKLWDEGSWCLFLGSWLLTPQNRDQSFTDVRPRLLPAETLEWGAWNAPKCRSSIVRAPG